MAGHGKPVTTAVHVVDNSLGEGAGTLRIALACGPDGEPETLVLSVGHGNGTSFHRGAWQAPPLTLPASALGRVREALAGLEALEALTTDEAQS